MRAIDAEHYWVAARFERKEGWEPRAYPFNLPVVRNLDELTFHPILLEAVSTGVAVMSSPAATAIGNLVS